MKLKSKVVIKLTERQMKLLKPIANELSIHRGYVIGQVFVFYTDSRYGEASFVLTDMQLGNRIHALIKKAKK